MISSNRDSTILNIIVIFNATFTLMGSDFSLSDFWLLSSLLLQSLFLFLLFGFPTRRKSSVAEYQQFQEHA